MPVRRATTSSRRSGLVHGAARGLQRQGPKANRLAREAGRRAEKAGHGDRRGAQRSRTEEQRIELDGGGGALPGAGGRADGLARAARSQRASTGSRSRGQSRRRVRLASAPLDVGPTLRSSCSSTVPTCVLTSATMSVGTPPRFDFIQSRMGLTQCRDAGPWQPVRLCATR